MNAELYLLHARRIFLERLLAWGQAACEIQDALPLPENLKPQICGSIPRPLADAGIIARAGASRATRRERHSGLSTIWRLADRRGAETFLRCLPKLKTPAPARAAGVQEMLPLIESEVNDHE